MPSLTLFVIHEKQDMFLWRRAVLRDFGDFRYLQLPRATGKLLTHLWGLPTNPRAEQY